MGFARGLVRDDLFVAVFPSGEGRVELRGFEAFLEWYGSRRARYTDFSYRVDELLGGERYAGALITLTRRENGQVIEWRQVAVYEVEEAVIAEIRGYEEPEDESGSW